MNLARSLLLAPLLLGAALAPAAADNWSVKDGAGAPKTFATKTNGLVETPKFIPTDETNAAYSNGNPLPIGGNVGLTGLLPSFATSQTFNLGTLGGAATAAKQDLAQTTLAQLLAAIQAQTAGAGGGTVAQGAAGTVPWLVQVQTALPAGANKIGSIDVASLPPLPAGASLIGNVGIAGAVPLPTGAATAAKQDLAQTTFAQMLTALQTSSSGGGGTVTQGAAGTVPWLVSLQAPLPAGSNLIGNVGLSGTVPLPTGASTAAKQDLAQTTLSAMLTALQNSSSGGGGTVTQGAAGTVPWLVSLQAPLPAGSNLIGNVGLSGTVPLPTGAATAAKQPAIGTAGSPSPDVISIQGVVGGVPQPVSLAALPALPAGANTIGSLTNITGAIVLPTGASTAALQTALNASAASIDTKTPTVGQKTMAGSQPVVIASDQGAIPVSGTFTAAGIGSATDVAALAYNDASSTLLQQMRLSNNYAAQSVAAMPANTTYQANSLTALGTLDTDIKATQPRSIMVGGTALSATNRLPIDTVMPGTASDVGGTIAAGGTAQTFMAANANRRGFTLQNQSAGDLFINCVTTASADYHSMKVPAGALFESSIIHTGTGACSILGATTAQAFYARQF